MYIVLEVQKNGSSVSTLVTNYADASAAESKYHQILTAAALSNVEVHSAMIMDEKCFVYRAESYEHPQEEPEE